MKSPDRICIISLFLLFCFGLLTFCPLSLFAELHFNGETPVGSRYQNLKLDQERDLIYSSDGYGLLIIDFSNPWRPEVVGHCPTPGWSDNAAFDGDLVYLNDYAGQRAQAGVAVINVEDPENPEPVGYWQAPEGERVFDVASREGLIYALHGEEIPGHGGSGNLSALRPSRQDQPELLSTVEVPASTRLLVVDDYLYLSAAFSMNLVSLENPEEPEFIETFNGMWNKLVRWGDYVISGGPFSSITFYDVRNPAEPEREMSFNVDTSVYDISVNDDMLVVRRSTGLRFYGLWDFPDVEIAFESDEEDDPEVWSADAMMLTDEAFIIGNRHYGLRFFDLDDPFAPEEYEHIPQPPQSHSVHRVGDFVVTINESTGNCFCIGLDGDRRPEVIGELLIPEAKGLVAHGEVAYALCGENGFRVIDLSDPADPQIIGVWEPEDEELSITNAAVSADGGTLYAGWFRRDNLSFFDVSDPENPRFVRDFYDERSFSVMRVYDNRLFAMGNNQLGIFDIADPQEPHLLIDEHISCSRKDFVVRGNYIYMPRLRVISIAVIEEPEVIFEQHNQGITNSALAIRHNELVQFNGTWGMTLWDISNPRHPDSTNWVDTPGSARDGCWIDDDLFAVDYTTLRVYTSDEPPPDSVGTRVSGEIAGVWSADASPYIVDGEIVVPEGQELTIEPGVEVLFEDRFIFRVHGLLTAVGTEEDSIYFRSMLPGEDGVRWWGIRFIDADPESIIEYARIEDAEETGGIYIENSSPTIRHCLIRNCSGRGGIAISYDSAPLIEANVIEGNAGDGISCSNRDSGWDTSPIIIRNIIHNNTAGSGISVRRAGIVFIKENVIRNNIADGGISAIETQFTVIEDNEIIENSTGGNGGGLSLRSGKVILKDNTITGNRAEDYGGGLYLYGERYRQDNMEIIASGNLVIGNQAGRQGGGIYISSLVRNSHLHNNVIFGNRSASGGGGVDGSGGANCLINNCIICGNEAPEGIQIGNIFTGRIGYCVVQGGWEGEGIIDEDPQFVNAEESDFHLREESPAIDTGHPFEIYNDLDGSRNDIGAYGGNPLLFGFVPEIQFPPTGVFCHAWDRFVLCNTGEVEPTLRQWQLDDEENFTIDFDAPVELSRYEWMEIPITFNPVEAGELETAFTLSFADNELFDEAEVILAGEALDGYQGESSGVWTEDASPIHVIGTVTVPEGDTLIVEPGVDVRFDPDTRLMVDGTLIAVGTDEDSVRFTSALDEPEPGSWRGLFVNGLMDYCVVEFAQTGICLTEGRVVHSTIRCAINGVYIQARRDDSGVVSHCVIENIHEEEEGLGRAVHFGRFGTLEFSRIINCDFGLYTDDNGYAYRNVFVNDNLLMSGWDSGILAEGNIFYQCVLCVSLFGLGGPSLSNNCLYETEQLNFEFVEDLNFRNQNGTPCDRHFNIIQDPLFVDPENYDFRLQEDSPCIDAGNPDWPRDPDGTRADIGVFPFNHDGPNPIRLTIALRFGWNLSSINIEPGENLWLREEGPDVVLMTDRLRIDEENHHIILMKNEDGQFYAPAFDFNSVPYWDLTEGYLIKVNADVEVAWAGLPIPPDADVPLEEDWNMIAYFPPYELDASAPDFYVVSPIIDHVILAKNAAGNFMAPAHNFSNMPPWRETQGYKVKVDADVVLNYPPEQQELTVVSLPPAPRGGIKGGVLSTPVNTGKNMSVLVIFVKGVKVEEGDQIAAFSQDGHSVGVGAVDTDGRCGLAVWGDDASTEAVDGLVKCEVFELRLWDADREIEVGLSAGTVHQGDVLNYESDGFVVLDVVAETAIPDAFYLSQNYPNPFNAVTNISYGLPKPAKLSIRVHDLAGRLIATLADGEITAGYHKITWNASLATSGIYFVKFETKTTTHSIKILLVR